MNTKHDPLALWRKLVRNEDPTPSSAEVAMAFADQATGKRTPRESLRAATGLSLTTIKTSIDGLMGVHLIANNPERERNPKASPFVASFPSEKAPPRSLPNHEHLRPIPVGGGRTDMYFDHAGYLAQAGWEEQKPGGSKRTDETLLYHYYDAQDVLLYIGITNSLPRRQASHEGRSTWMDFAARSTMKRFPTRVSAEAVEMASIRHRRPLFNIEHNDYPDRVARLVDYLIERDRRDLLVPLISRG